MTRESYHFKGACGPKSFGGLFKYFRVRALTRLRRIRRGRQDVCSSFARFAVHLQGAEDTMRNAMAARAPADRSAGPAPVREALWAAARFTLRAVSLEYPEEAELSYLTSQIIILNHALSPSHAGTGMGDGIKRCNLPSPV